MKLLTSIRCFTCLRTSFEELVQVTLCGLGCHLATNAAQNFTPLAPDDWPTHEVEPFEGGSRLFAEQHEKQGKLLTLFGLKIRDPVQRCPE